MEMYNVQMNEVVVEGDDSDGKCGGGGVGVDGATAMMWQESSIYLVIALIILK